MEEVLLQIHKITVAHKAAPLGSFFGRFVVRREEAPPPQRQGGFVAMAHLVEGHGLFSGREHRSDRCRRAETRLDLVASDVFGHVGINRYRRQITSTDNLGTYNRSMPPGRLAGAAADLEPHRVPEPTGFVTPWLFEF